MSDLLDPQGLSIEVSKAIDLGAPWLYGDATIPVRQFRRCVIAINKATVSGAKTAQQIADDFEARAYQSGFRLLVRDQGAGALEQANAILFAGYVSSDHSPFSVARLQAAIGATVVAAPENVSLPEQVKLEAQWLARSQAKAWIEEGEKLIPDELPSLPPVKVEHSVNWKVLLGGAALIGLVAFFVARSRKKGK